MAKEAVRRKTGARGLRAILEDIMLNVMYEYTVQERYNQVCDYQRCYREKRRTDTGDRRPQEKKRNSLINQDLHKK